MRTHSQLLKDVGPTKVASAISVSANTVHGWKREDSIPGAYWRAIVLAGFSSYEELALAAQSKARAAVSIDGAPAEAAAP